MSNQLQHRLQQFEVEPPASMWDSIGDALDDQASITATKLDTFEAVPPAGLWSTIENELEGVAATPAPIVPFYKRYATPLRYSSAAAILLLVAFALNLLFHKDSVSSEIAVQPAIPQPVRKAEQPVNQPTTVQSSEEPVKPMSYKRGNAPLGNKESRITYPSANNTDEDADNSTTASTPVKAAAHTNHNRYLTVASETGKTVRLSKKVYPVFDCAEHSSALERFQCQENIESLQKMASSLISPSGDFASLMDMIKTLEENR